VSGASAVVLNATVDAPTGASFLTVWPTGTSQPVVSNLNFLPGQTVPNLVTVELGSGGRLGVYNHSGSAHVILDVMGWYAAPDGQVGSRFHPLAPAPTRILDTRDGTGGIAGPVGSGGTIALSVLGHGVPVDGTATAAVVNVTVTQPTAPGFLTVYPGDLGAPPVVSNLNFVPGLTVPNLVIVRIPPSGSPDSGMVKIFNSAGSTHVVVDVMGWFDTKRTSGEGLFDPVPPARILDTRGSTPLGPGETRVLSVVGQAGIPASNVRAVVANVTVTDPTSAGFLTVYPFGGALPPSSNLNFVAGQTVPNLVMVGLTSGALSYYNFAGSTQVIVDVGGWFTSA
jgi:hypothetical protein